MVGGWYPWRLVSQISAHSAMNRPLNRPLSLARHLRTVSFSLFCLGIAVHGAPGAADLLDSEDVDNSIPFDIESDTWKERPVERPELSDESNWAQIDFSAASQSIRFFIDLESLSLSDDGVLHYLVVLRNRSSVSRVYFEGMNCRKNAFKRYAWARVGGPYTEPKKTRWHTIGANTRDYHYVLSHGIFCDTGFGANQVYQIRDILRDRRSIDAGILE